VSLSLAMVSHTDFVVSQSFSPSGFRSILTTLLYGRFYRRDATFLPSHVFDPITRINSFPPFYVSEILFRLCLADVVAICGIIVSHAGYFMCAFRSSSRSGVAQMIYDICHPSLSLCYCLLWTLPIYETYFSIIWVFSRSFIIYCTYYMSLLHLPHCRIFMSLCTFKPLVVRCGYLPPPSFFLCLCMCNST
jgi:hypothetical protein